MKLVDPREDELFKVFSVEITIEPASVGYNVRRHDELLLPDDTKWRPTRAGAQRLQEKLIGREVVREGLVPER